MNKIEKGGYAPPEEKPKRTYEYRGQQFEVEDVNVLYGKDIQPGDRVLISTESGNRYMIRFSKSADALKIYNERESGFKTGEILYDNGGPIAEIDKGLNFIVRISNDRGQKYRATKVTAIEIRRGIDKAIEEAPDEIGFGGIARMLKDHAKGRLSDEDLDRLTKRS